MFKVSVMYPNRDGARFDLAYYRTTHMELVRRHMQPFGLVRTEVLKGLSGRRRAAGPVRLHRESVLRDGRGLREGSRRLGRGH